MPCSPRWSRWLLCGGFGLDINVGFVLAIVYCFFTTLRKGSLQRLSKAVTEGISNSAGAIFLLIGIGMLLVVVMDARVSAILGPAMASILPGTAITFVVFFSVLAPLSAVPRPAEYLGPWPGPCQRYGEHRETGCYQHHGGPDDHRPDSGCMRPHQHPERVDGLCHRHRYERHYEKDASLCMGRRCGGPGRSRLSVFLIIENLRPGSQLLASPDVCRAKWPCRQKKGTIMQRKIRIGIDVGAPSHMPWRSSIKAIR